MTDTNGRGETLKTRFSYLRSDGTAYIVGGSAVAGVAAYAYQLLGGRVVGPDAFAPVSVLLTVHFLTFIVILLPIEQLMVRRLTVDANKSRLPRHARILGALAVLGATWFALDGVDRYLNGDGRFVLFTAFTVAAHFLFATGRGHLAGRRRFKAYGLSSGGASLLRLVVAVGVTLVHPSASGFALGLIIGPFFVMAFRPFRTPVNRKQDEGLVDPPTGDDRGLLTGLVLAAAASQALLLGGPLVVGVLGGTPAQISIAFAVFTLGRAPLTFGYNLLARVLPPFTEMAASGERQELRAWARGMAGAAVGLSFVAAALGWTLGPWLVELAFGEEFAPSRLAATLVATGVVFAGASLFVGQILVARNRPSSLATAWAVGLLAGLSVLVVFEQTGVVTRVAAGFTAGELAALGVLVGSAVYHERGDRWTGYQFLKRSVDISVALVLLLLTAPIVLAAGIVVRVDSPGPIFFRQVRIGQNHESFGLLKIRTMHADSGEERFAEHLARLEASRHEETSSTLRIEGDDRTTRVGVILRRWSLDELPNLWNVLEGTMSLVGPRPLVPDEARVVGLDNPRFSVKPGVTGWAQVHGRDSIGIDERTRLDLEYVVARSTRRDLGILGRTLIAIFKNPGD